MVSKAVEHGVYRGANPCVVEVLHSYPSTGDLPAQDVTCPAVDGRTTLAT
jgi:hypothetical protein